jgi:AraC-like DNA-binding protein
LVRELGGDPAPLLRSAGIDACLMQRPDRVLAYAGFIELLERTAERVGCAEFGLLLSQRQGFATLGPVGLLCRQEPDVRHGIEALLRYVPRHAEGLLITLAEEYDLARVTLDVSVPGLRSKRQIVELSLGMGLRMLRLLLGARWKADAVYFTHTSAAPAGLHQRLLEAPVFFGWEFNGLEFPAASLDVAIPGADEHVRTYLIQHLDALQAQHGDDLVSKTRRIIQDLIHTGRCTVPHFAGYLGMNARTLQRRLRREGTTFKALTEEVRATLAAQHLRDSDKPLTEIANMLGYSELSVFTRSFRRWRGVAPSAWRAARRGPFSR